jgi:hypothetical protein
MKILNGIFTASLFFSSTVFGIGNNSSNIYQSGTRDTAEQEQTSVSDCIVDIEQIGNFNYAKQTQSYSGFFYSATILQEANHSIARQFQTEGRESKAFIDQQCGTYNVADQVQSGGRLNCLSITQCGSRNSAGQSQRENTDNSNGIIFQKGNENEASQAQIGAPNSEAIIEQNGLSNEAHQFQYQGLNLTATIVQSNSNNYAFQNQESGTSNDAIITQQGIGNTANQSQIDGVNKYAEITQIGAYHFARQSQFSTLTGDRSTITQYGSYNRATVVQQGQPDTN